MSAQNNDPKDNEALVREATRLYLRLRQTPDDGRLTEELDTFLAQGDDACRAYEQVSRAMRAIQEGARVKSKRIYGFAFLGVLLAGLAVGYTPLRIAMLADFKTAHAQAAVTLASGDTAILDAGSAIIDDSSETERRITLLAGSGLFDVDQDGRRFVVSSGDIDVDVLGTVFEVSRLNDAVLVAVAEGVVEIRAKGHAWQVTQGQRFVWRDLGSDGVIDIAPETVAGWRSGKLNLTGMTLGAVVDIIERRLPGRIVVVNRDLRDLELSGGLDISDPLAALETLVAIQNARILVSTPLGTVVTK